MKTYIQPKVDFLTLEVINDVCVTFDTNAASPVPQTGITIGGGGIVVSE